MNTRRTIGQRRGGATAGGNQVAPQDLAERVAMPVNPDWLNVAEVWASLDQMTQSITMQPQDLTDQVNRLNV